MKEERKMNTIIDGVKTKYLIIHPKDCTTDFLCNSYKDIPNKLVVRDVTISKSNLKKLIKFHDVIIMLGHGVSEGLICSNKPIKEENIEPLFGRLLINSELVQELREKLCIGIWCHASDFFEKYRLIGFSTGMFISDLWEADQYSFPLNENWIDESNNMLGKSISETYCKSPKEIYNKFIENFTKLRNNKIAEFNYLEFRFYEKSKENY